MRIFSIFIGLIFISNLFGQQYTSNSRKAIGKFESAIAYYNQRNNEKAIKELESAIKADESFIEAFILLGQINEESGEFDQAIHWYNKAIAISSKFFPPLYYSIGNIHFSETKYSEAKEYYAKFLEFPNLNKGMKFMADLRLKSCEFSIEAIQNPVPFELINLGTNINSEYDEFWPSISVDGESLVITRLVPKDENNPNVYGNRQEDFYISYKLEGNWSMAESIGDPLNTKANEGAQTLTSDGKTMYFTACNRAGGAGMCDIYVSYLKEGEWTRPISVGKTINTRFSEKQPSISADGNTLYFASDRPGSLGQLDIWKSVKTEDGIWGTPQNLGDTINTIFNDQSPYIHPDNESFYFSSEGHPGLGGFDIFLSKFDGITYSVPKNLGYPINTNNDEVGLIIDASGTMAYFSSDREPENGRDIYRFEIYKEVQPKPVSYLKGIVYDADTKLPLKAKFELIDIDEERTIISSFSKSSNGEFFVSLPTDRNYALNVSRENYLFFSENFAFKGIHEKTDPYEKDVQLKPIKVGESIVLKNIFYETASYELLPTSKVEMDKLITFLTNNPDLKIEISGHTDNVGGDEANQVLSEKRAQSVVAYLVNNGIKTERLEAKGYGESKPIADNNSEEGRSQNRRTEFKIIGN